MYETYEELMERKLDLVSNGLDKRQGSIIFDALAPNAAELAQFYADLQILEDRTFGDTAKGEDLTRRTAERGVFRKTATSALFIGQFLDGEGNAIQVAVGSRFSLEELRYAVVKAYDVPGKFILECETAGRVGNSFLGKLLSLDYIEGLAKAELLERIFDGEDEETDEELRKRYLTSFDTDAFGGNISDYKQKVGELNQVGGVKVFPAWQGGGTVKLTILDRGYGKPTLVELADLQERIDPQQNGSGVGIAPIGHRVTVAGVTEVSCEITAGLILEQDMNQEGVIEQAIEAIKEYLFLLRKEWADVNGLVVRISHIEARILNIKGVLDVNNTTLNGDGKNLLLGIEEIPIFGKFQVVG